MDLIRFFSPPQPVVPEVAKARPLDVIPEKIDFHISRFERALAQCGKGRERKAELRANLDYWKARKAAEALREGVK